MSKETTAYLIALLVLIGAIAVALT